MQQGVAQIVITLPDGTTQSFPAAPKEFKTGSRGFHAQGKIAAQDAETRYQVNIILTEIGSKPA